MSNSKIYGLLGRKLGHSFSVQIHRALGCPEYRLIELEPEELKSFLIRQYIGGLNITIPYKRDVIPSCTYVDSEADEIGAVNTIVPRGDGLHAYNTDKYGFEYAVKRAGIDFNGKKVLILGSGGTSRTATAAAKSLGASEVVIISRSGENNYGNLDRHSDAEIIVNTTPVGMYPNCPASPVSLDLFPNCTGVMDVVYNPLRTGLLMDAASRSIPCSGGLFMLVAQAKAAEELFTGRKIDDSVIDSIASKLFMDNTNIVIIGMPGSGKSSVGQALSKLTGRELVDMDRYIEDEFGTSPEQFILSHGEKEFRKIETRALTEICGHGGKIIATGGGVVTVPENYSLLHQNGRVYCLSRPLELLATEGRPLSTGPGGLLSMYSIRKPMYEKFMDVLVDNRTPVHETALAIWREFNENISN